MLSETAIELDRQFLKWGEQNHAPAYWLGILAEEVVEVAKGYIEGKYASYRVALIHVAAVALSAAESFDRNGAPK